MSAPEVGLAVTVRVKVIVVVIVELDTKGAGMTKVTVEVTVEAVVLELAVIYEMMVLDSTTVTVRASRVIVLACKDD